MSDPTSPIATVRPLLRTRQIREFTSQPPTDAELEAITEAARWSGSSKNEQPWRFIVIRDPATTQAIHDIGLPQTRSLTTATVAVAVVLPADGSRRLSDAYDDGRASERMLIAASMLGLGAGIAWIREDVLEAIRGILGLPHDRLVRTIVSIGHPTEAAQRPKTAPGTARRPRQEAIFEERWPTGWPSRDRAMAAPNRRAQGAWATWVAGRCTTSTARRLGTTGRSDARRA